jgi:hypothetical protein
MQWGGSPVVGAPPTLTPLRLAVFWLPSGPGYWRSPLQPYPGQPRGTPPP